MTSPSDRRPDDTFDFNARARGRAGAIPASPEHSTGRGRRLGTTNPGTAALAVGGMAFYWMLPALLRNRRRPRPKTSPPIS